MKTNPANFASSLYGKVPGLRIAASPGGSTSGVNIVIRGINSITGKTQPLIVMDGVPIRDGEFNNGNYWGDQRLRGTGLLDINPEDIESISVLKGASAAALYGSEAVNGVLLITSKSGKGKKGFSLDVNASTSIDKVAYLPEYQNVRGAGAPLNVVDIGQDEAGFMYTDVNGARTRMLPQASINFGAKFDGQPIMSWDGVMRPYSAQTNNYANLFQTAHNSSINVALSNSSENSNMRFSFTHQDNQGVSLGSGDHKNIANLNSTYRIGKKFSVDLLVNYINQKVDNRPYSIDRMINNFAGMMGRFDNGDWYLNKYKTSKGYKYVKGNGTQSLTPDENIIYNGSRSDILDFVWNVKENNEAEYSDRLIANITNNYQITNDLKLRARFATDVTSRKIEDKNHNEVPVTFSNSGYYGRSSYQDHLFYGDVLLTYTKKITSDLEFNLMGGYTAKKDTYSKLSVGTNGGLSIENRFDLTSSVDKLNTDPNSDNNKHGSFVSDAYIGTMNISYKDYLFLEGNVRRDRYSTMSPDNNSFVYPSFNGSFILSDAVKLPSFISFSKLRASWGIVGNYPEQYAANVAYNISPLGVQAAGGKPILYTTLPTTFGNDKIRPEKKHEIEFGLQTRMFDNRVNLDISYYNAQVRDQILPLTLPISTGASSVLTNVGTLRNSGLEIGINVTAVKSKDFRWDVGVNWAMNQNKVEKLANNATELLHVDYDGNAAILKSVVGQPMGDLYAHPILENNAGQKLIGSDGLYQIDADKMKKIGNVMPKATGGIFSTVNYKSFSLDAMVDFRLGGYVMPTGLNWMTSRGLTKESLTNMDAEHGGLSYYNPDNDGTKPGVQTTASAGPNGEIIRHDGMLLDGVNPDGTPNTNVVSQAYYYWNVYNWGGPQYSEARYELYVQKNTYFKMREISFGYELPSDLVRKIGASKLKLSVFGRNLFYIYRTIKDMDAEATTAGSRWFQNINNAGENPSTRTFGVMLRASF
jgi:TonB-linked SusC/RagA family outer membrane protein